ncbi:hypothetical protein KUW19_00115 [Ferrimonas balearica]|uniref:hypothetical protein n=1 Tax=Ferrimonas balearica TaxID=44012 RepID=UPI001C98A7A6|nr:hypothetical protein [Ferrimonas balearica]MBY6104885.1 hypothetical protein [Ferrimonas balearica]
MISDYELRVTVAALKLTPEELDAIETLVDSWKKPVRDRHADIEALQYRRQLRNIDAAFADPSADLPARSGGEFIGTTAHNRLGDHLREKCKAKMQAAGGWWSAARATREFGITKGAAVRLVNAFARLGTHHSSINRHGADGLEVFIPVGGMEVAK